MFDYIPVPSCCTRSPMVFLIFACAPTERQFRLLKVINNKSQVANMHTYFIQLLVLISFWQICEAFDAAVVAKYALKDKYTEFLFDIHQSYQWGKELTKDIKIDKMVSSHNYFNGVDMEVEYNRISIVDNCPVSICSVCNGTNVIHYDSHEHKHSHQSSIIHTHLSYPCPSCLGFGITIVDVNKCSFPYHRTKVKQMIHIPPGTYKDQIITYPRFGNELYDNGQRVFGSLILTVENIISDDTEGALQIQSNYVKLIMQITPQKALSGFQLNYINPYFLVLSGHTGTTVGGAGKNNTTSPRPGADVHILENPSSGIQFGDNLNDSHVNVDNSTTNTIIINRQGNYTLPETNYIFKNRVLFAATETAQQQQSEQVDNHSTCSTDSTLIKTHPKSTADNINITKFQDLHIQFTLVSEDVVEMEILNKYNCIKQQIVVDIVNASRTTVSGDDATSSASDLDQPLENNEIQSQTHHIVSISPSTSLICTKQSSASMRDLTDAGHSGDILLSSTDTNLHRSLSEGEAQYVSLITSQWNEMKARDQLMRKMLLFLQKRMKT